MSRGKHGQAARARATGEVLEQAGTLEKQLRGEREAHDRTRMELQLAQTRNASAIMAARREAAAMATEHTQAQLDAALMSLRDLEAKNKDMRKRQDAFFGKVVDHFIESHNYTGADAVQHISNMMGMNGYIVDDMAIKKGLSVEQVKRLDRVRGNRTVSSK